MRIRAFKPFRPAPELAPKIASLPYDVVTTAEARELARGNPLSMLHIVRAEIDLPEGTNPYSDPVYARARLNFARFIADGAFIREETPSLFLYRQEMGTHQQTGVVALCHVDDYDQGLIKRHEKTRPDKENDRTRLTNDLSANTGPVFLTYRQVKSIDQLVPRQAEESPLYDFTAVDGIRHTVWRISDPTGLLEAFQAIPAVYVADGHHRAASAARVARERRDANSGHTGDEDYNWFLTVLFPDSSLKVLPYNRLVTDLRGQTPEDLLNTLKETHRIAEAPDGISSGPGDVRVHLGGRWHRLNLEADPQAGPAERLDVSLLQDQVLAPLLGIQDPRTDTRIEFVGGIRGVDALTGAIESGHASIAFSLHPVTVTQLMDIADAGQIMPPKSTWFEPKLRSGLFVHTF
ncbi:MAG: DUF1015 family protein [Opitutaceae bacterium]